MLKPPAAAPSSERRPSPATGERLRLHGGPGAPVRPQRGGLPHLGTRPLLRPHRSGAEQDPARERGAGSGAVRAREAAAARQGRNVWIRDIQGGSWSAALSLSQQGYFYKGLKSEGTLLTVLTRHEI